MSKPNVYTCPYCTTSGEVLETRHLYPDVRFDIIKCPKCSAGWRVYYRVSDFAAEVTAPPACNDETCDVAPVASEGDIQDAAPAPPRKKRIYGTIPPTENAD